MSGSSSKMKLKKLSLCGYDFKKFIKQIDSNVYYLAKHGDRWVCGHFTYCGIGSRDNPEGGHSWDFDMGMYRTQLSYREPGVLDKDFKAVYEVIDPELIAKRAKTLLKGEKHDERSE